VVTIFLEYDLIVVYKPNKTHVIVDVLSKLPNVTKPLRIPEQTTNVNFFFTKPEWLNDVKMFL